MMTKLSTSLCALSVLTAGAVQADVLVDFEAAGYVAGESVHNHQPDGTLASPAIENIHLEQQAWFIPRHNQTPPPDEAIVDLSGSLNPADAAHGKVWRLSQGATLGTLGGAPQSPHAGFVAGETGALNDAGRGPVSSNRFTASFDFKSATGATQNGLAIAVQGSSFDQRHGFVRIVDDGAGFDLVFFDTVGTSFPSTTLDTNLSYTDWHNIQMEITFHDGFASGGFGDTNAVGNDVLRLFVNGSLVHTGTSWESAYAPQGHAESIDALTFTGSTIEAQLGGGLYFDNIAINSQVVPEPASLGLLAAGGLMLLKRRRHA